MCPLVRAVCFPSRRSRVPRKLRSGEQRNERRRRREKRRRGPTNPCTIAAAPSYRSVSSSAARPAALATAWTVCDAIEGTRKYSLANDRLSNHSTLPCSRPSPSSSSPLLFGNWCTRSEGSQPRARVGSAFAALRFITTPFSFARRGKSIADPRGKQKGRVGRQLTIFPCLPAGQRC